MRGLWLIGLLALAGCNPGITPHNGQNEIAEPRNTSVAAPPASKRPADAVPANIAEAAPDPDATSGPASMSPYRRREYERGYRDCMSGNFDGERQGESYRIGCMAAEDVKQRRSGR